MCVPEQGGGDAAGAGIAKSPAFPPLVKLLLDRLDEGIVLLDPDDRIRLWNEVYAEMLDIPLPLFFDGAGIEPLIRELAERGDYGPGEPDALTAAIAARVRSRAPAQGERKMANGKIIAVEWVPFDNGWFLFRLRDVTGERNASRFKDELIATVSHELRTPLTVISGALALLRAGVGSDSREKVGGLVEVAHRNSERLGLLVNDLLDIDKLQSATPDFRFAREEIGALLTAAVEQNRPYAEGLGVAIDLELPDTPVTAEVDRDRLLQVMSNLLSNAAKFSARGSRVRVRLTPQTDAFRISVIDKGRGMSEEFHRRLFTRFAQENRDSEHGQIGTGLGLAICKSIVDQHGGQIHAETRQGVGTVFRVDLPLKR